MGEKRAVILLSGGLDSATTLAIAKDRGYSCHALTMRYGQRHAKELESANALARHFGVQQHLILDVPLDKIKGSALTDESIDVPQDQTIGEGIPMTYVPARNIIFLSFGLAWAETVGAECIFIGANAVDFSGYPDCTPRFFETFEEVVKAGTKCGVEGNRITIEAPLLEKTKAEIIELGNKLSVPFGLTWSCYLGSDKACGRCDSCQLRLKGFKEAGVSDPLEYDE